MPRTCHVICFPNLKKAKIYRVPDGGGVSGGVSGGVGDSGGAGGAKSSGGNLLRAVAMNLIHMGRATLPPLSALPRVVRWSNPVQTPVHRCGEYPTKRAS